MSIKITSLVWTDGPADHGQFIVLLTLADFANPEGECWPSVKTIATRSRTCERSVIRALKILDTDGWISVLKKSREHKGNTYQISLKRLTLRDTVSPSFIDTDDTVSPDTASPDDSVTSASGDNPSLDFGESRDTESSEPIKVRCQSVPSQVTYSTESGDKSAKPPYPLIGRTTKNRQEPPKRTQAFVVPPWVPRDAWFGFMEMRRKKRVPTTDRAKRGLLEKLDKLAASGQDPGEVIDQSTERGWTSFYEVKRDGGNNDRKPFNRAQTAIDSTLAAGRAALADLGFDNRAFDPDGSDDGRAYGLERRSPKADGRRTERLTNGRH